MRRVLVVLLAILSGLGLLAQPAAAVSSKDVAIALSPSNQTISLTPGQEYRGKITVVNIGTVAYDFSLLTTPYQVDSETYDLNFNTNNVYTQLYTWISFPQTIYHIEPGQTIEAEFIVNVPASAAGGGQYATVMVRAEGISDAGSAVQVVPQVASLIYGRVNGPEMMPEGEVAEQTIPGFVLSGPLTASETVYNTGNVDFKVYHALTVTDFFSGDEIFNADTRDANGNKIGSSTSVVLPGTSRQQTLTWENTPKIGIVKVKQTVMFLEEEVNTEQIVIFCPLWLILSVVGLIILGALWIFLAARRRKRKAPQVF